MPAAREIEGSGVRPASSGTLTYGVAVGEVLGVPALAGAQVVAGARGLDRVVQRLNVMEVPDILPWVKPHELLLTTGYPLRHTPQVLSQLVADLDERGLAALGIKLGRYIDELPPQMLATADQMGFPIILLPNDVGFDDILNQVLTDILNRQAAVLARSEEVHRALVQIVLAGGGLKEVADELVRLFGGAVLIVAADGEVLAQSGSPEDLAAARASRYVHPSGRVRLERLPLAGERQRPTPRGERAVVAVPIVAGGTDHGRIVAFSPDGVSEAPDVLTLERAATVAALVITKQLAVSAVESKYQTDFLHDLISGRTGGPERAITHSAWLGWDIARPLVVVVAELDPAPGDRHAAQVGELRVQERLAAAWTAAVRARDPKAAVVGFTQEVVALVGVPQRGGLDRLLREIVTQVAAETRVLRRSFSTGVSRVVGGPEGLPAAYEQARRAVAVGRQIHGPGALADFDSLGVYRLLSLIPDSDELRAFVRETLGELATRDDEETQDLRRTLRVLLETNLNVAETARRLHFHYNTLRYRIGKLERMLGPFTGDPHLRLNLTLALHVVAMRGL
ncbi:PucR family transcriptional regulator [Carbonactinospora thermoautotrophica]|uniref:PucR family transcriptional regulator n=2 Tax=Carbonactinospora thermoautotrophica TaxID=1469144 RepID=UPI000AAAEFD3|nr:PucR family transcriptional regulator [Carbonactinospora thermoautotrophica]